MDRLWKKVQKQIVLIVSSCGCCLHAFGQSTAFEIGYYDTLIYNHNVSYNQFGYNGPAPLFVQIWHPVAPGLSEKKMLTVGELRNRGVPPNLQKVYERLCAEMDSSFIAYNLLTDFPDYNEIDYGQLTAADVIGLVNDQPTQSQYKRTAVRETFPVIVYHHGTQGLSDENFFMAEFFASRGYVFISCNFHLPYEQRVYGLVETLSRDVSAEKTLISFAREIAGEQPLTFIGHSWGAQVGWLLLGEGSADNFVSMETTIEFKKDSLEIKDKWPYVYDAIRMKKVQLPMPVLLVANTRDGEPFTFFENSADRMFFVSAKDEFGHESYTSAFLLRYYLDTKIPQPDRQAMSRQVELYYKNLELIAVFLDGRLSTQGIVRKQFEKDFFISEKRNTK